MSITLPDQMYGMAKVPLHAPRWRLWLYEIIVEDNIGSFTT